jgi:[ribosomal protein S18]-alanine N-acetyltransferase
MRLNLEGIGHGHEEFIQYGLRVKERLGLMSNVFSHLVTSEEELRDVLGHPGQLVQHKVIDYLDLHCLTFIESEDFIMFANPMIVEAAIEIADWIYVPPYDFYNMGSSEETLAELMNGAYWSISSSPLGELIGFYCLGHSAQVPAGHEVGAYATTQPMIDMGLGLRPDLTGQGQGYQFLTYILKQINQIHSKTLIRLTVATFNLRAIHLYTKFGFEPQIQFRQNDVEFLTMIQAS